MYSIAYVYSIYDAMSAITVVMVAVITSVSLHH